MATFSVGQIMLMYKLALALTYQLKVSQHPLRRFSHQLELWKFVQLLLSSQRSSRSRHKPTRTQLAGLQQGPSIDLIVLLLSREHQQDWPWIYIHQLLLTVWSVLASTWTKAGLDRESPLKLNQKVSFHHCDHHTMRLSDSRPRKVFLV